MAMHFIDALCLFSSTVVDVSAQGGCTITPINPTTLTAAGGVLASGTENVTIQCNNCTDGNGTLDRVRWYDPAGTKLFGQTNTNYVPGTPYFTRVDDAENDITLVIPTFNDSYDGIYTCGERVGEGELPGPPNAAVTLTTGGK